MGDSRYTQFYERVSRAPNPAAEIHALGDEEVIAALAAASKGADPYLANVLATEAMNRVRRASVVANTLGEGVIALDSHGRVTFANPAAERLLGWPRGALVGRDAHDTLHRGCPGRNGGPCAIRDALHRDATVRREGEAFRRSDGATFLASFTSSPIDSGGEVQGAVVVFRDVTGQRRAEDALAERETLLRTIVETEPECVKIVAPDGTLAMMNPAGLDVIQADDFAQVRGAHLDAVIAPDHRSAFWGLHARVLDGHDATLEFELVGLRGARRWMATHAVPLRNAEGEVEGHLAVTHDITKRKRAEALQAGEERVLKLIASGAPIERVLHTLAEVIEGLADGMRVGVLLADATGERLVSGAAPSLPKAYCDELDGIEVGPETGPCSTAAHTGAPIVVEDISNEKRWPRFRELAAAHGLAACWSAPVEGSDGKVLGTFALYYHEPRAPTAQDREVIETATHLAGIAVERDRWMRTLQDSRRLLQSTLDGLSAQIAVLDAEGAVVTHNAAWSRFPHASPLVGGAHRVGTNYLEACRGATGALATTAARVADAVEEVLEGRRGAFYLEYPFPSPKGTRWFAIRAAPLGGRGDRGVVVAHEEATAPEGHAAHVGLGGARRTPAKAPAAAPREAERLAALRSYAILDTPPEREFDDLALLAARVCGAPSANVCFVDDHRQWLKARVGFPYQEVPRESAMCTVAIQRPDEVTVVRDAREDPRFAESPLVTGEPGVRFYAGAPLVTPDGHAVGTLCVMDSRPRGLTGAQAEALRALARQAVAQLELRRRLLSASRDAAEEVDAREEVERLHAELEVRVAERTRVLRDANQELEAFTYTVSHDLSEPLRGIEALSRFLLEDYGEALDATGVDYLERMNAGARRMKEMLDGIRQLSHASRGEVQRQRVDLSALATEVCEKLRERDPGRRVEVRVAPGVEAAGDPRLLRVALENLLGNAWKYTANEPVARIEVGARDADGERVFFVRDNGAGFDMADAGKLFRPFQRLHGSEFEGTGVGLPTVQRAIHRHGGRVWGRGAVGEGATFCFTLG